MGQAVTTLPASSLGYDWDDELQAWYGLSTNTHWRNDPLRPHENPLQFDPEFIAEAATNPDILTLGLFCNGWEL